MKLKIERIRIDYNGGMIFFTTKKYDFMCEFSSSVNEETLSRVYRCGLQCQYEVDSPEYNELKEQQLFQVEELRLLLLAIMGVSRKIYLWKRWVQ